MPGEAQTHRHLKRPSQFHADGSRKKPRTEIAAETPADEEMAEAYPEAETKPLRGARATGFPPQIPRASHSRRTRGINAVVRTDDRFI